jgi:hypothetical protein
MHVFLPRTYKDERTPRPRDSMPSDSGRRSSDAMLPPELMKELERREG